MYRRWSRGNLSRQQKNAAMARKTATKGESAFEKSQVKKNNASKKRDNSRASSIERKSGDVGNDTILTKSTIESADKISGCPGRSDYALTQDMSCASNKNYATMAIGENMDENGGPRPGLKANLKNRQNDSSDARPSKRRRRCMEGTPSVSDSSDERAGQQDQILLDVCERTPVLEGENADALMKMDRRNEKGDCKIDLKYAGPKHQELNLERQTVSNHESPHGAQCTPATNDQSASNLPPVASNPITMQKSAANDVDNLEAPSITLDSIHQRCMRVASYIKNRRLLIRRLTQCRAIAQQSLDASPQHCLEEEQMEHQRWLREANSRKRAPSFSPNPLSQQKSTKRSSARRVSTSKQKHQLGHHCIYVDVTPDAGNQESILSVTATSNLAATMPLASQSVPSTLKIINSIAQKFPTTSAFSAHTSVQIKRDPALATQSNVGGLSVSVASSKKVLLPSKATGKRSTSSGKGKRKSILNSTDTDLTPFGSVSSLQEKNILGITKRISLQCPELTSLRERRAAVLEQLSSIGHLALDVIAKSSNRTVLLKPIHHPPRGYPSQLQTQQIHIMHTLSFPPFRLPTRRKSHWDYVMEEMRWLSSDFIEERKWKMTAARTISSAIAINQKKREVIRQTQKDTGDPTTHDLKSAKVVAKVLSSTVTQFWSVIAGQGLLAYDGLTLWSRYLELKAEFTKEPHCELVKKSKQHDESLQQMQPMKCESELEQVTDDVILQANSMRIGSCDAHVEYQNVGEGSFIRTASVEFRNDSQSSKAKVKMPMIGHSDRTNIVESVLASLTDVSVRLRKLKTSDFSKVYFGDAQCGVTLMPCQLKAIRWVEMLWTLEMLPYNLNIKGTGAIVTGGIGTGKTVAISCMIWSLRMDGPQLVICAPHNLIRWKHELRKLSGLNVIVLGYDSNSTAILPDNLSSQAFQENCTFEAGDVLLCELESLNDSEQNECLLSTLWGSIVLDCRFFAPASSALTTTSNAFLVPMQLDSHSWWRFFLKLRCTNGLPRRRVLIDGGWGSLCTRADSVESWARKVAFLLPTAFHSSAAQVMRWAKRHQFEGGDGVSKKDNRIQDLLQDIADRFIFSTDSHEENHGSTLGSSSLSLVEQCDSTLKESFGEAEELNKNAGTRNPRQSIWALRLCYMNDVQKEAYSRCCRWLKGALSGRATCVAANALLKLRVLCLHSDTNLVINSHGNRQWNRSGLGIGSSNIESAQSIVNGSSKMRELLRILLDEAKAEATVKIHDGNGFFSLCRSTSSRISTASENSPFFKRHFPSNPAATKLESSENSTHQDQKNNCVASTSAQRSQKKKVLILASLPEALFLVHILLNSCGIAHEFLTNFTPTTFYPLVESNEVKQLSRYSQMSTWIEVQNVFARFDLHSSEQDNVPQCDVLVATPAIVGAAQGGLRAGAADIIVSVDEDWSRQGSMIMESIIKYCESCHSSPIRDSFQLIKLVCADTCEETFLVDPSEGVANSRSNENGFSQSYLTVDSYGAKNEKCRALLRNVEVATEADGTVIGAIERTTKKEHLELARCIVGLRNQELSTVLKLPLSPDFSSGKQPVFLPRQITTHDPLLEKFHDEDLAFARELFLAEKSIYEIFLGRMNGGTPAHQNRYLGTVCVSGLVGRRDLSSFATRLYCWRYVNFLRSLDKKVQLDSASRFLESEVEYERELAEAWQRAGLGCSPGDQTETLLFYAMTSPYNFPSAADSEAIPQLSETALNSSRSRLETCSSPDGCNLYAFSYSSNRTKFHDGHCYREPLVYAPPLFTGWGNSGTNRDKSHTLSVDATLSATDNQVHVESTMISDVMSLEMDLDLIPDIDSSNFSGELPTPLSIDLAGKKTILDELERMNGAKSVEIFGDSVVMDALHDEYPLSIMVNSTVCSMRRRPSSLLTATSGAIHNDSYQVIRDFSFSGGEKLLNSADPIALVATIPIETGMYRYWQDPMDASCDASPLCPEDYWISRTCFLESILLYVNRPLPITIQAKGSFAKKHKRKLIPSSSNEQHDNSIQCVTPGIPSELGETSLSTDTHMQTKGRERLMYFLIQEKVDERIQKQIASSFVNSRSVKRVCGDSFSTVSLAPRSCIGEQIALNCRVEELKRLSVVSHDGSLDPFGFVAVPSDMSYISRPIGKIGVALPMGVNIFRREDDFAECPWSEEEDETLKTAALRYSFNWHVVAHSVQAMKYTASQIRSARQCCARWRSLAIAQPSISQVARKVDFFSRTMALVSAKEVPRYLTWTHSHGVIPGVDQFMGFPIQFSTEQKAVLFSCCDGQNIRSATPERVVLNKNFNDGRAASYLNEGKRMLSLLKASGKKKLIPSAAIPKIASIDLQSGLAATHPSHLQALQEANFCDSGAGPIEMWPLQFLDFAEKKKTETKSACGQQPSQNIELPVQQPYSNSNPPGAISASSTKAPLQPGQTNQIQTVHAIKTASSLNNQKIQVPAPVGSQKYPQQASAGATIPGLQKYTQQASSGATIQGLQKYPQQASAGATIPGLQKYTQQASAGATIPKGSVKPPKLNRVQVMTQTARVKTAPPHASNKQPNQAERKK